MKTWIAVLLRMTAFGALFFLTAGTLDWPEAWAVLAAWTVYALALTGWLQQNDPDLLRERMRKGPFQEGQKGWDKVLSVLFLILTPPLLFLPGLDAVRYGWTHVPVAVEVAAFLLHLPSLVVTFLVMRENTFLSRVVKIDAARGHTVVTTGPYRYVRHPMYAAAIVMMMCFPVALGSLLTLMPAAAAVLLTVVRTHLEDRMLHEELPGYRDYAARTRYRLVPGLW